ncbi:MAG: hypothetical protein JNK35_02480 [Phycisphaerae bacterium]|nr:hypothetical protein [Phycisphaerae bacterium]
MTHEPGGTPLRQKLGYYALGVAVGFCLLSLIWANRARVQRERDAAQAARAAQDAARAATTAPGQLPSAPSAASPAAPPASNP